MKIKVKALFKICSEILKKHKTSPLIAKKVIEDLLNNDYQGYSSHGILRILEYVQAIKDKNILPNNKPRATQLTAYTTLIDGQKAFGCITKDKVVATLISHLKTEGFGFVSVINSGHFGRLRNIAAPVSENGGIVIGFANFSGAGQNVLPYGGAEGRLCTNPMVFSVPHSFGEPIVLDMSTSSIAEGKVREAYLEKKEVPKGWLIDKDWQDVTNPEKFYEKVQTAFLSPLGGRESGYKGFGLALITEILAGILTGGGYSKRDHRVQGNSAIFIVLSRDIFGQSVHQFQENLQDLLTYIDSSPIAVGFNNIRIPGLNTNDVTKNNKDKEHIFIPEDLWINIRELYNK